jgi:exodeoxyribonuclease III
MYYYLTIKQNFMLLVSWNVNGIRAGIRKETFIPFIEKFKPDILCLQETKANREQVEIDLPDYEEYWNSAEKKGYSGTAIFSKEKPIDVILDFLPTVQKTEKVVDDQGREVCSEGRLITAEFKDFYVVTVYTPNTKNDLSRLGLRHKTWDPLFLKHCKKLEKKKPVIFCGDLNVAHKEIDLARPKANVGKAGFTNEEREAIDNIINAGFIDTLRHVKGDEQELYTWWSHWGGARERNVGWRIDYFFVSESLKNRLIDANIHPKVLGSDHCPVSIEIK